MKAEPLKGKGCETRAGNPIHLDKDICSAVELARKLFYENMCDCDYETGKCSHDGRCATVDAILGEAFEDVIK